MSQPSKKALEAGLHEIVAEAHAELEFGGTGNEAVASIQEEIDKAVAEEREENAALVNRMIGCGRAEIAAAIRARSEA